MKVVADAGPIIALAKIDRLALLESLFEESWISGIVAHELLAKRGMETRRMEHAMQGFVRTESRPCELPLQVRHIAAGLDDGERSAIALACTFPPPAALLIDDAAGRVVARQAGLSVLGFAGLLIKARQAHLIERAVPLLLEARDRGYWLDDEVISVVRRLTSE